MLLPAFLTLLLVALQPAFLMYTRAVMESAACETARVAAQWEGGEEGADACRAFAERRLAAVPDLGVFHAGGPLSWDIEINRGPGEVSVRIAGAVEPLPVLGAFAAPFGERDARGNIRLEVEAAYACRPAWVEGGYDDWVAMWG